MTPKLLQGKNDLQSTHPEIASEWSSKLNGNLKASEVVAGSEKLVWWVCPVGHNYQSTVVSRCKAKNCPICNGRRLSEGVNDLQTTHPELAAQWHPSKNGTLTPNSFTAINSDLVWWKCPKGHEYQLQIKRRVKAKSCSVCSNTRLVQGINDFESRFPEIATSWILEMNGGKSPSSISAMSKAKYWWRCERNPIHEYKASVQDRVFGSGCAVCSGRQVMQGVNDLATLRPDLLRYWDHNKNIIKPTEISIGSGKKVWWKCELGHEMFLAPAQKTSKGVDCAVCAGKKVLKGYNDLQTTHPEVAKRWHPNLNESLMPDEVVSGSNKKVWWVCESDARHIFQSPIYVQSNHSGNGCPICVGKLVVAGLNDLSTLAPDLISEWNEAKNEGLSPSFISFGSDKKVWWVCSEGHEWRSSVKNRTKNLSGCPRCVRSGYDPTLPGLFYFIENQTLQARKVGVTNPGVKNQRTKLFKKFGWTIIETLESDNGYLILDIETHVLRWIRKELGLPRYLDSEDMNHMGGASETFSASDPSNEVILKKIMEIHSHIQEKHHPQN
jgi:hypothetical protein